MFSSFSSLWIIYHTVVSFVLWLVNIIIIIIIVESIDSSSTILVSVFMLNIVSSSSSLISWFKPQSPKAALCRALLCALYERYVISDNPFNVQIKYRLTISRQLNESPMGNSQQYSPERNHKHEYNSVIEWVALLKYI